MKNGESFEVPGIYHEKKSKIFLHFFHAVSNFSRFFPTYLKLLSAFKMEELQNFKPKDLYEKLRLVLQLLEPSRSSLSVPALSH